MNKTEVKLVSPSLAHLLSYAELKMPLYQRSYGWGLDDKADAGLEYFTQFLINAKAPSFFGQIYLFSDKRWDYLDDEHARVWLSDGQHRLVTIVLSSLVLIPLLQNVVDGENEDSDSRDSAAELLQEPELVAASTSKLEVVVTPGQPPEEIVTFLQRCQANVNDILEKRDRLEAWKVQRTEEIKANKDKLERERSRKALREQYKADLEELAAREESLMSSGVVNTFYKIHEYLRRKSAGPLNGIARNFVDRLSKLRSSVVCLQPEEGSRVPLPLLEDAAFAMFAQMNGQAFPLNEGELLRSYITSKKLKHPKLNSYLERKNSEHEVLKFFGMNEAADTSLCDFFTKMTSGNGNIKSYTWVKSSLYSGKNTDELLNSFQRALDALSFARAKILCLPESWKSLFELFIRDFGRVPYWVFLTHCCYNSNFQERPEAYLKAVLRMLILLEVSNLFQPNQTRINLGRDLPSLSKPGIPSALAHIQNHFNVKTCVDLKSALSDCLVSTRMGQLKTRKLAKLLLILADFEKPGRDVTVGSWAAYDFEHVFPQSNSHLLSEKDLPDIVEDGLQELLDLSDSERSKYIDSLGNGALLEKKENSSLSNNSPYYKYQKHQGKSAYANAWWPSHRKDLEQCQGNWDRKTITERARRIANDALAFIVRDDDEFYMS